MSEFRNDAWDVGLDTDEFRGRAESPQYASPGQRLGCNDKNRKFALKGQRKIEGPMFVMPLQGKNHFNHFTQGVALGYCV